MSKNKEDCLTAETRQADKIVEREDSGAGRIPGEWSYHPETPTTSAHVYAKGEYAESNVADVYGFSEAQCNANARLIAAAPELLEALRQITNLTCESSQPAIRMRKVALAAITKAEGRTE